MKVLEDSPVDCSLHCVVYGKSSLTRQESIEGRNVCDGTSFWFRVTVEMTGSAISGTIWAGAVARRTAIRGVRMIVGLLGE